MVKAGPYHAACVQQHQEAHVAGSRMQAHHPAAARVQQAGSHLGVHAVNIPPDLLVSGSHFWIIQRIYRMVHQPLPFLPFVRA